MTTEEKIVRMANPTQASDYGLSIKVTTKEEADKIFKKIAEAKK